MIHKKQILMRMGGGGGCLFGMLLFRGLKAFKIMILEGWVDRLFLFGITSLENSFCLF